MLHIGWIHFGHFSFQINIFLNSREHFEKPIAIIYRHAWRNNFAFLMWENQGHLIFSINSRLNFLVYRAHWSFCSVTFTISLTHAHQHREDRWLLTASMDDDGDDWRGGCPLEANMVRYIIRQQSRTTTKREVQSPFGKCPCTVQCSNLQTSFCAYGSWPSWILMRFIIEFMRKVRWPRATNHNENVTKPICIVCTYTADYIHKHIRRCVI